MANLLQKGLVLLALANPNYASLNFENSGVWSEPRIYSGTTLVEGNLNPNEPYTFKTKVENNGTFTDTSTLEGTIAGTQEFYWTHGPITLEPGTFSIRQQTLTFNKPGDYNLKFSLDSGEYQQRDFTVIPEPATLLLLGSGILYKKFRKSKRPEQDSNLRPRP